MVVVSISLAPPLQIYSHNVVVGYRLTIHTLFEAEKDDFPPSARTQDYSCNINAIAPFPLPPFPSFFRTDAINRATTGLSVAKHTAYTSRSPPTPIPLHLVRFDDRGQGEPEI